jgi:hypothetical protein
MVTLADIAPVFNLVVQDSVADQMRHDVFLLNVFRTGPGQNARCTWDVKGSGRDNARVSNGSDANYTTDFDTTNVRGQGSLPWARYESFVRADGLAMALAQRNASLGGGLGVSSDLFGEEAADSIQDLTLKVGADLYGGDPAAVIPELCGLDAIVTGDSFAGLDRTDAGLEAWTSVNDTLATGSVNDRTIRDRLLQPFRDLAGKSPELCVCSSATFNVIADAVRDSPSLREVRYLRTTGGMVDLSLVTGIRYLQVEDTIFVQDRHCPANTIYALHTEGFRIRVVANAMGGAFEAPNAARVASTIMTLTGKGMAPEDIQQMFMARAQGPRLAPWMKHLGAHGDSDRAMFGIYTQMEVQKRHHVGRLVLT